MIAEFLQPVNETLQNRIQNHASPKSLYYQTRFLKEDEPIGTNFSLAILGIPEDRASDELMGCSEAPDRIRHSLYRLIKPRFDIQLIDLGNIRRGASVTDTYVAVRTVLNELLKAKIPLLILGGSDDLITAHFQAYKGVSTNLHLVTVDSKINMQMDNSQGKPGYIPQIIQTESPALFSITQAGYQGYFVEPETYDAFERMNFDLIRLGALRGALISDLEPYCRNADMLSFSMNAIRAADAPGQFQASPNGFSGEEACQIARYAGISNDLSSFGIYNLLPALDREGVTSELAAQMAWYFIEGYCNRKQEYPVKESLDYTIYRTTSRFGDEELVFYKSNLSNRWWMEVPYPKERTSQEGKFMVPCSYKDYQQALNDEIPDRWMKTYQKLL